MPGRCAADAGSDGSYWLAQVTKRATFLQSVFIQMPLEQPGYSTYSKTARGDMATDTTSPRANRLEILVDRFVGLWRCWSINHGD